MINEGNTHIFEMAGVNKEMSVVYEDSINGITSAKLANILCVGIHTEGFNDLQV